MKILSPAGNLESLKAAVYNGADEVYLGINNFNARNNIEGFNLNNLQEAINFAHFYNVKVNLAINILFNNNEIQDALNTVVDCFNMGVDSFIIQDLGLIYLINKHYPEIEIHASTQMGIHNYEGVKFLEKFNIKRVVLARETPLNEIKRINENSNMEIEYFCHGALCVSFSGNCYLSSYLFNASGNRGKCKQLCRLPYTLLENNKEIKTGYLLSAKDFNMINNLTELKQAGVDVLKIEGRARRPYYVGATTREYYNALNNIKPNDENLLLAFNREYTPGYFNGNGEIISNYNNHIGIKIGKIKKVEYGKKFNIVYFTSNKPLTPKSTFKIFENGVETNTLTAYDLTPIKINEYKLTTTQNISENNDIHLINDFNKEQEILNYIKKKDINISLFLKENEPIKAEVFLNNKKIEVIGEVLQTAIKAPIKKEDVVLNFNKNEYFNPVINFEEYNNVFITKQKLNDFRRNVYEKVKEEIINLNKHNLEKIKVNTNFKVKNFKDFQIIENLNETLKEKNIIYSPEIYSLENIIEFQNLCKNKSKTAYLDTPNFALKEDIILLNEIIDKTKINIIANNYYALSFNTNIVIGAGLNVYNNITASVYSLPILTAESEISTKLNYPYMTLRHCPIKNHLKTNCNNCKFNNNYTLKMQNGKILKLKRKKLNTCTFYLTD